MKERSEPTECPYCGSDCEHGYGYCHCGCGRQTQRSTTARYEREDGVIVYRGQYGQYVRGHVFRRRRHGGSALTEEQVRIIRRKYLNGNITQTQLAEQFNVSAMTISNVLRLNTYKNAGIATQEELDAYNDQQGTRATSGAM